MFLWYERSHHTKLINKGIRINIKLFKGKLGYEAWVICDNEDASTNFVATEILVFDSELFKGV
jgi:hypothetical protein